MDMMKAAHPPMIAMLLQAIGIFGITYLNEPNIFLLSAFIFGLGFGAATPLMTACYLRIFLEHIILEKFQRYVISHHINAASTNWHSYNKHPNRFSRYLLKASNLYLKR